MDVRDWIEEFNEEALMADGFDDAIIGMCGRFGASPVVAYDRAKCIDILVKNFAESLTTMDMDEDDPDRDLYEEAEDYFEYNIAGSYVGENTPVFITLYDYKD